MPMTITAYVPNVMPGVYQAVCTDVQEKAPKNDPGNVFRVWTFTLRDGTGRTVEGSSSIQTTPKSKGGKWLAALLGRAPEVGEQVEPVGCACTIVVAIKDTTGYEYVEMVAAPEKAAASPPVRPLKEMPADTGAADFAAEESDQLPF